MKHLHFFFATVILVASLGLSSCKDSSMLPAPDAEQAGIARAPVGKYSEYIISPDEAIDIVANDLKQSGGVFAQKRIADIEPLLFSDFEFDFNNLQELGAIKVSDPLIYIVRFEKGGYALMTCDKDFGVEVFHVQTGGDITQDEITTPSKLFWANSIVANFMYKFGLWEEFIHKWGFEWRFRHAPYNLFDRPSSWTEWANNWQVYKYNGTNPVPNFLVMSTDFLESYGPLGTLACTVLEFLGYHKKPSILFGIQGDWNNIFSYTYHIGYGYPAAQWAFQIENYCNYGDFSKIKNFLLNECSGEYPNARILELIHDYNVEESGELSDLLINNKPVIVKFGNKIWFVHEEYLRKDLEYLYVVNAQGYCNVYPTGRERYSSRIRYVESTSWGEPYPGGGVTTGGITWYYTDREYLSGAFYIAY